MINTDSELDRLNEILKKNPKGLTIAEIAKLLQLNRISTSKYLNTLLVSGLAEMRIHGPSKVFYPSQRVPISSLLNFSTSLLLVMNDNLSIIDANNALLNLFSLNKKDLIGHRIDYSPLGTYINSDLLYRIQKALDSKEGCEEVNWMIGGEERYLTMKITPTVFEDGNPGVTIIADDITELTRYRLNLEQLVEERSKELKIINEQLTKEIENHKKARTKLQKSERKYRELVENANCLIIRFNTAGNIIFFNEFAEHFLGYSGQELLGKNILDTFIPEIDSNGKNMLDFGKNLLSDPEKYTCNICEIIKKDNTRGWISWTNKKIEDSHGNLTGILAIGNDITNQKRIEEKLIAIIDFLPDATFVIDTDGTVIAWNHAIETLTGVKAEDIIGKGNHEYSLALYNTRDPILVDFALKPDQEIPPKYYNCKREGDIFFAETYTTFHNSGRIYLWGKASPLYDSSGNLIGAIESFRDITSMKQVDASK